MLAFAPRSGFPIRSCSSSAGSAIGFLPGMPEFELDPELVFFGVLPPLLYSSAFFTSLRDLRANLRPIGLLAVGLVPMTTVGVAVVAHAFVDVCPGRARSSSARSSLRPTRSPPPRSRAGSACRASS